MRTQLFGLAVMLGSQCALAQSTPAPVAPNPQPLYRMTIVSKTTKALNYGYLTSPTRIGFKGTPVMPHAEGEAKVDPGRGATLLTMKFEDLEPPSRFGAQYLTYVAWAISPDGRAQNLGELILDGSDEGRLTTSTPLQTFALILTAEPYYSVSHPSDVVIMENVVTRDTIGKVQEVNVTYELMPRKGFTWDTGTQQKLALTPVSPEQYESITALYQALNAIQIAQSQQADRYAGTQLARARQLYNQARSFPVSLSKEIVSMAREAAQIAEDSRAIAVKRAEAERLAGEQERARTIEEQPVQSVLPPATPAPTAQPPSTPQPARHESPAAQTETPVHVDHSQFLRDNPNARENRTRLLAGLPRAFEVIDTSRGVVVTIPEQLIDSTAVRSYFTAMAAAVKPYQDLHIEVGAHSDAPNSVAETERLAEKARAALIAEGIPAQMVSSRGYGNSRPRGSNLTAAGKLENRRVEVVIAGDSIGSMATWDHTYRLQPSPGRK